MAASQKFFPASEEHKQPVVYQDSEKVRKRKTHSYALAAANLIGSNIKAHKKSPFTHYHHSIFCLPEPPRIPLEKFMETLLLAFVPHFELEQFVLILIYIDRYLTCSRDILHESNAGILVVLALIASEKTYIDNSLLNRDVVSLVSKIIPLTKRQWNELELEFYKTLKFKLLCDEKEYVEYRNHLVLQGKTASLPVDDEIEIEKKWEVGMKSR